MIGIQQRSVKWVNENNASYLQSFRLTSTFLCYLTPMITQGRQDIHYWPYLQMLAEIQKGCVNWEQISCKFKRHQDSWLWISSLEPKTNLPPEPFRLSPCFASTLHSPVGSFHLWLSPTLYFSSVQLLSRVRLFATPWTIAHQASLSITNSQSLPKLMSIESVMPSNRLILCRPLLLLPSIFPHIRVFSNESALRIIFPICRWKMKKMYFSVDFPLPLSGTSWLSCRVVEYLVWDGDDVCVRKNVADCGGQSV